MEPWLNKVHLGDCVALLDSMPANSIDLMVTGPPYNIKNSTGNGLKDGRGSKWTKPGLLDGYDTHNDSIPHEEYVTWQHNCLSAMMRVLKEDGAILYNHKWRIQGDPVTISWMASQFARSSSGSEQTA